MNTDIFVEETLSTGEYKIVFGPMENKGENFLAALDYMKTNKSHKLELWSKAHAASPKGFSPLAFTDKGLLLWSNTLSMLFNLSSLG